MPGNRNIYQDAIKKGHNAAWDAQWPKAVAEYRRALLEFPDDVSVRLSYAHALEETGQFDGALREYRLVADKQSNDPMPLTHVAEMQAKLLRPGEAAATYLAVAEVYLKRGSKAQVVETWNIAAKLEPDRTDIHQRLAEIYEQGAQRGLAASEYLAIARIYDRRGDKDKALNFTQRARSVDPENQEAHAFLQDLEQVQAPVVESPNPVSQAQKEALSRLAETLLEDQSAPPPENENERRQRPGSRHTLSQPEIDALIARAVDAQMHHRVANAIEAYRRLLDAQVTRPEVRFNLGLLYVEAMRYDDAVDFLTGTVDDKNYGLASHFALGQCYRAQGKMDQAVEHFLQVTRTIDLASVQRDQADELISVYEELADSYAAKGDRQKSEAFTLALEKFLTDKGWEDKVNEFRHHIDDLRAEGEQVSLAEVIGVPQSDKVLEALALAQEYTRREKFWAASEECYRAIELSPNYLPGHVRLAEVLAAQGRSTDAHTKFQTLAELSLARGDRARAEVFYRSALKIAGDDVGDRSKLIDLLIQQDRIDDALEQHTILGDGLVRGGQFGKAAEQFAAGVRLAGRSNLNTATAMALRHRLAEARARQGDFRSALAAYQEIHQQLPEDERAHFYVVDLEFRLGQPAAALRDLEEMLTRYQSRGEPQKATAVLESLAQSYPNEGGLANRLAQNYVAVGAKEKAISTLDALGELYLSAGQKQSAVETIKQILELDPPRAEDYQKLLQQIGE